ncbi:hypothetical protein EJ06DRAFT_477685 [Trichodelitschia bisporula]|uniref:Jacalin-type lectin domain-containing protein n=1 Tax=Trichodelitschia bisporula TaxID=703511 RepID=A0A6G1HVB6_9PEZI|nr:hypothetical protein EJ06DRAFT_477685 [Trichodelitschia bisporula]
MTRRSNGHSPPPLSYYAPHVTSIRDGYTVHQKVLLIKGQIGDPEKIGELNKSSNQLPTPKLVDGEVLIHHHQDSFPPIRVPVVDSRFKALVHLQAGRNNLCLEFFKARASTSNLSVPEGHKNWVTYSYLPMNASPPLHLALLLAKDSPGTFDAVPARIAAEGNDLETAKRKFRMAAYLWQAYTAEQMGRHGFHGRCFRFEEEWQTSTLAHDDPPQMRSEARIHVIRLDETLAELRSEQYAQKDCDTTGGLFQIAKEACKAHFPQIPGQKQYVACMYLDTHWDQNKILAHAAAGGSDESMGLAVFGSHALQAYPASVHDVIPTFSDCTRTDTQFVANELQQSGSVWEAATAAISAHLHQVGHAFGLPHRTHGIMAREFAPLNRSFTVGEPYSTRTRAAGRRVCPSSQEAKWHRTDCLRFRYHPCFRHNLDSVGRPIPPESSAGITIWTTEHGPMAKAETGIAWIELYRDDEELSEAFKELIPHPGMPGSASPPSLNCPTRYKLDEVELRDLLKQSAGLEKNGFKRLRLKIYSTAGGCYEVDDLSRLTSKEMRVKLPSGQTGFRGGVVGPGRINKQETILDTVCRRGQPKMLLGIRVYFDTAIDGLEFLYEDSSSQLIGNRGNQSEDFTFDIRRGETFAGFYVRCGTAIDALQVIATTTGRKSPLFGNISAAGGYFLMPPYGYQVVGITTTSNPSLDSMQLIITR